MYISVAHIHLNIDSQTLTQHCVLKRNIVFTKTILFVFPIESDAIVT